MNLIVTITSEKGEVLSENSLDDTKAYLKKDGEGAEKDNFVVQQCLRADVRNDLDKCFRLYMGTDYFTD